MGKRSRTKGHAFERRCAADLRGIFPGARRHLEYQDGEAYGVDLEGTGRYRIQCKKLKAYASVATIEEVELENSEVPVLVTAADGKPAMAVLPWAHFVEMLKMLAVGNFY